MINPELLAQLMVLPIFNEQIKINNAQKGSDMMRQVARGVDIRSGDNSYDWDIVIAPISDKCILGLDFLKAHKCYLDLEENTLRVGKKVIPTTLIRNSGNKYAVSQVIVNKRTRIPPMKRKIVYGRLINPACVDFSVQPVCNCQDIFMAASLVKGNNVQIPLFYHYLTLKKNQHIGNAVESNVIKESDIDSTDSISSHGTLESNHELTDPKDNDTKYDSDSSGSTSIPTFNVRKTSTSVDEPIEKDSDIQKEELIKVTSKVPPCVLDLFLRSTRKLNTWQSI